MSAEKILSGKVALITGGTSGVGEAAALLYAEAGAKVVFTGRSTERGKSVAATIKKAGGEATFYQIDLTGGEEDVKRMIDFTVSTYGRLDCAFNNAGISGTIGLITETKLSDWNTVVETNLTSIWLCLKHEITQMIKQGGGGTIVNHASIAGLTGLPMSASYGATKFGIVGLTKSAALEYVQHGIRVNAVCPGNIDTPMVRNLLPEGVDISVMFHDSPMERCADPKEVAEAALWLSSPKSSFINGHSLILDGGELAGRRLQAMPSN